MWVSVVFGNWMITSNFFRCLAGLGLTGLCWIRECWSFHATFLRFLASICHWIG
uniref:Uncharacterized protein MANES_17G110800 n=1 Tax=Rhizophora mucronata TaxID=61149 RepID=A0A2P2KRP7_RHIMU